MRKHWLAWATILLIGSGSAWAAESAPEPETPPTPLTLDYTALENDGRPGAWIPAPDVKKLNLWQIELRECRDIAPLRAREDALQGDLDGLSAERQALAQTRLELEKERTALAREEAELERQRARRAERRGFVSRVLGFVGLAAGAFLAR